MPDAVFDDPRLAAVYDPLDPDRSDLDLYAALVDEFGARSVLDIGCGTGTFACMLAARGVDVVGVDPAGAMLDVARRKEGAERVTWVHGDASALPPLRVDLATMTANVAQVFLTDEDWAQVLGHAHAALRAGGRLVFETRDPAREAWREWTKADSYSRTDVPGVGIVDAWVETTSVALPLVTFQGICVFHSGDDGKGETLVSDSTLRFRGRDEVEASLGRAGFTLEDVRDAPDRPGREFVFIARRDG